MKRTIPRALPSIASQEVATDLPIRITLATPMFGGGHTAGTVDPDQLFSTKAIRGQLRFWWRKHFVTSSEYSQASDPVAILVRREEELFGSVNLPSPFDILVSDVHDAGRRLAQNDNIFGFHRFGPEAYALFAARANNVPSILKEGSAFSLSVQWLRGVRLNSRIALVQRNYHECRENAEVASSVAWQMEDLRVQLSLALRLWLTFGGIGGRTRRGLGAISTDDRRFAISTEQSLRDLAAKMAQATLLLGKTNRPPLNAWSESIDVLRRFRQTDCRGPMHNKNGNQVPGRSRWPEPDSIRQISGCALQAGSPGPNADVDTHNHSVPIDPAADLPLFPRALLGLPIIFEFSPSDRQDASRPQVANRDPAKSTIVPLILNHEGQPEPGERLASPVFTRPVRVGNNWYPCVLILRTPQIKELALHYQGVGIDATGRTVTNSQSISADRVQGAKIAALSKGPATGVNDALTAFENYLQKSGFA